IDNQWVAFPTWSQLERATFNMVVAGRIVGDGPEDVAIMMVEAEATDNTLDLIAEGATAPTEQVVAQGLDAAKPFIRVLCEAQQALAAVAAKPTSEFPLYPAYQDDVYQAVEELAAEDLARALTIAGKQERDNTIDEIKAAVLEKIGVGEGERFEGRDKEVGAAFRAVTKKLVRERILRDKVRIDGRGPTDIRSLSAEVG